MITVASMIGSSICLMSEGSGKLRRVIHLDHVAGRGGDAVAHAGRGGDQVDLEFALQALLHDLQVQQAEEAAAEAEAQRDRILGLEVEGAVVEPQFLERVAQQAVLVRFHRVESGEHHRLDLLETGQRLRGRVLGIR